MGGSITSAGYISSTAQIADDVIVAADIDDDTITLAKLKAAGTATHVLTSNGSGAGAAPEYKVIPAATGANCNFIETITLGSANSSMVSSAITAGTYIGFIVHYYVQATDVCAGLVKFNADSTSGHYLGNRISRINTTITAADRSLTGFDMTLTNNTQADDFFEGTLHITNLAHGYKHINLQNTLNSATVRETINYDGYWTESAEISTIQIDTNASTWKTGSTMSIWGLTNI